MSNTHILQPENDTLDNFFQSYPHPQHVKAQLWELLVAAMGSEHADMWSARERADQLFFHE